MWLKLANNLSLCIAIAYAYPSLVLAQQIKADIYLPLNQRTQVTNNSPNFQIDGGATKGTNLFHSFSEFSVPVGGEAFFNNATAVQNIISRVTGSIPSNIQGTIRANGTANLFLINPQGIIFGPNARLNIGGSFIASTASSVTFTDGIEFSATNPDTNPLLTINQPIGLQFGTNPGRIENQSRTTDSLNQTIGLQVQANTTLALVGGDLTITGGVLTAPNGRIELGSVGSNSVVNLTPTSIGYILNYKDVNDFQNINLRQATATTIGSLGGSIHLQGANISLTDGSLVQVGIFGNGIGEGLTVNASESVQLIGSNNRFFILNEGTAISGDLTITSPRLLLQDGAEVVSSTTGVRKSGNLNINASEVLQVTGSGSRLFTQTESTAANAGDSGNLTIHTGNLLIQNRGQVSVNSLGAGDGGNLTVNATKSVELVGRDSRLLTESQGLGDTGNLTITTPILRILDGGQISVSNLGAGKGGNLTVNATESTQLIGRSQDSQFASGLFAQTQGSGNAGNIIITTPVLRILDGAQVSAGTLSAGKGGNLTVNASASTQLIGRSQDGQFASGLFAQAERQATGSSGDLTINTPILQVFDGAQVSAGTLGAGKGGNLTVNATESTQLIGRSQDSQFASGLFAQTQGSGNAGNIIITTPILRILDGAQVSAGTLGVGQGGNLTVNASASTQLIGRSQDGQFASGLFAQAERQATGSSGDLTINTPILQVFDGAQVSTGTLGTGQGGNLTVNATETVELIGRSSDQRFASGLFSQTQGTGNAGAIRITTPELRILDGAEISAATLATGKGGNVIIKASDTLRVQNGSQVSVSSTGNVAEAGNIDVTADLVRLDGGKITAQTLSGNGGDISLSIANLLFLRRGSAVSTTAGTNASGGDGGNIKINIPNGFVVAIPSENTDITANAFTGSGGRIDITAQNLFGIQSRPFNTPTSDITASSQFGINGVVNINTPDVDPARGVLVLSTNIIDPSQLIEQSCVAVNSSQGSQLTVTGRGGLPVTPNEPLTSEVIWSDTRLRNRIAPIYQSRATHTQLPKVVDIPNLIPATGWIFNNQGQVTLVAHNSTAAPNTSLSIPTCQNR
ncbi:filamentous hemagglutinin N-terminal domain-containing protein [Nostoc piscinale]|uniref:two-partner secretion domain-containing protein n=1 Tax=Nostoc piscinale TaxID=224012 RepID=UPI00078429FE|nr:filamentous hemagglutinin N-terminal domain-containing protein [Nostoc piscinale]